MKILQNIPGAVKLYGTLGHLNKYKKAIDTARASGDFAAERENILAAATLWSSNVMKMFGTDLNVAGKENLPAEGPVVYIGNHQGYADIIAYCAALDSVQFGFVAKDDLGKIPIYGKWIRRIRSVLIKRGDARESMRAIDEGIELIRQGFSLMIFPEGTRSLGPEMGEFKRGAFKLATKPGVPVIPVSINGSYHMFEETGVVRGTKIDVMIHPAVKTEGLSRKEEKELTLQVEETVRNGVKQLQEHPL